jgi:hypothetical protein
MVRACSSWSFMVCVAGSGPPLKLEIAAVEHGATESVPTTPAYRRADVPLRDVGVGHARQVVNTGGARFRLGAAAEGGIERPANQ